MPSKPVTWSISCKNPSRTLILVLQRWAATQVVAVDAVTAVAVVIVVAVAGTQPATLLHLAEVDGKPVHCDFEKSTPSMIDILVIIASYTCFFSGEISNRPLADCIGGFMAFEGCG